MKKDLKIISFPKAPSFLTSLNSQHYRLIPYGHQFKTSFQKTSSTLQSATSTTHSQQDKTLQNGDYPPLLTALSVYQKKHWCTSSLDDSVLNLHASTFSSVPFSELYVDLTGFLNPSVLTVNDFRPDLLLLTKENHLYVFELTVGFWI